jgi:adenosylcobinamide-GDP ribazoletransferase
MRQPITLFLVAIQFLTVAPPIIRRIFTPQELGRSLAYYPLVGMVIGAVLAGLDAGLSQVFPEGLVSASVLTAWVLLTGALHLDGFLDSCDGLFGGYTPAQRLEIMRDERVGAFGLAGGVLLLLSKYAALNAIHMTGGLLSNPTAVLILTPTLGRWTMSLAVVAFPYARPEGLGKTIKAHAGRREAFLAILLALAIGASIGGWVGLAALPVAGLVGWGVARFSLARLPGLTGDLYGAICEIVELALLLFFAIDAG